MLPDVSKLFFELDVLSALKLALRRSMAPLPYTWAQRPPSCVCL